MQFLSITIVHFNNIQLNIPSSQKVTTNFLNQSEKSLSKIPFLMSKFKTLQNFRSIDPFKNCKETFFHFLFQNDFMIPLIIFIINYFNYFNFCLQQLLLLT